jgi:hypothetical protein
LILNQVRGSPIAFTINYPDNGIIKGIYNHAESRDDPPNISLDTREEIDWGCQDITLSFNNREGNYSIYPYMALALLTLEVDYEMMWNLLRA